MSRPELDALIAEKATSEHEKWSRFKADAEMLGQLTSNIRKALVHVAAVSSEEAAPSQMELFRLYKRTTDAEWCAGFHYVLAWIRWKESSTGMCFLEPTGDGIDESGLPPADELRAELDKFDVFAHGYVSYMRDYVSPEPPSRPAHERPASNAHRHLWRAVQSAHMHRSADHDAVKKHLERHMAALEHEMGAAMLWLVDAIGPVLDADGTLSSETAKENFGGYAQLAQAMAADKL